LIKKTSEKYFKRLVKVLALNTAGDSFKKGYKDINNFFVKYLIISASILNTAFRFKAPFTNFVLRIK
jgi:hypothetical protein